MVTPNEYRQALAKFATGVAVIGSLEADGSIHGMTANALTSISLDPPLVLVCIGHMRNTYRNVRTRGRFGINVLSEQQRDIAHYYARQDKDRVGDVRVPWLMKGGGSPRVEGSLAFLECRVVAHHDHGDHAIFIAEVEGVVTGPGQPLLFHESQLRNLDDGD